MQDKGPDRLGLSSVFHKVLSLCPYLYVFNLKFTSLSTALINPDYRERLHKKFLYLPPFVN